MAGVTWQRDPLGYAAGASLYSYVLGNPTNRYDPKGLLARKYELEKDVWDWDWLGDDHVADIKWQVIIRCDADGKIGFDNAAAWHDSYELQGARISHNIMVNTVADHWMVF